MCYYFRMSGGNVSDEVINGSSIKVQLDMTSKFATDNALLYGLHNNKTCLPGFANNKGADQPAHPRRLISTLLFTVWKVSYLDLLRAKFQFSS